MKLLKSPEQVKAHNKRVLWDYNRFKDLKGRYNMGRIDGDTFTLYRIKDNSVITRFNVKTFEPVS